ncbi:MAG: DNA polymerase III subunit gamma/tau [Salinisphaera sp.]|nr:DNA polymerase III subunit gamma/tau [Salinisphaera sp.]
MTAYQALARRWRPRRFSEVVGQDPVVRALRHALEHQRLHHALLFSGTRGVGKTTFGRILAKCLNCETGVTAEPCQGELCRACAEIDEGRFIDLIEVDAASRTGVEDIRELLDNVQYAPALGRYKVYLIDEVHMLSRHAFNALLKTLEEPPPHVQFLLATTEPQKIPVTVLSRCLQFPLKRVSVTELAGQLQRILDAEQVQAEAQALRAIALAAGGSVRDALSLLDQALAFTGGALTLEEVHALLGSVGPAAIEPLLVAIADGDAATAVQKIAGLDERAPDYAELLSALASAWHRIAVLQLVPSAANDNDGQMAELARRLSPEDVQIYYDITLAGRRDLAWAPDPASGLEMTCLRMLAFRPATDAVGAPSQPPSVPQQPLRAPQSTPAAPAPDQTEAHRSKRDDLGSEWDTLVGRLSVRGVAAELARNATCLELGPQRVLLALPEKLQRMCTPRVQQALLQALQQVLGSSELRLDLDRGEAAGDTPANRARAQAEQRRAAALQGLEEDPNVRALKAMGAKLEENSVQPGDEQLRVCSGKHGA